MGERLRSAARGYGYCRPFGADRADDVAARRPRGRLASLSMRPSCRSLRLAPRALASLAALAALALPASALAAPAPQPPERNAAAPGTLTQLPGPRGCLVDRSAPSGGCGTARALKGPGPVHGLAGDRGQPRRQATSTSPPRKATRSRSSGATPKTGALTQPKGAAGMHRRQRRRRLRDGDRARRPELGRGQPRRPQRLRDLARRATRSPSSAATRRPARCASCPGAAGCISGRAASRLRQPAAALLGARRGRRQPRRQQRLRRLLLRQRGRRLRPRPGHRRPGPARRAAPAASPRRPAAARPGIALGRRRGDGDQRRRRQRLRRARALSNAVVVLCARPLHRRPRPGDRRQRLHRRQRRSPAAPPGVQLSGANAVAVSPGDDDVYVTSLFSNSVTSFTRSTSAGGLDPEGRHRRLPGLPARRRLLVRPRARVARRGSPSRPDGRERLRRRLRHRRDRRPRPQREVRRGRAEAGPRRLPRAALGAGLHAAPGRCAASARSRSAPTAAISTRPRSAATPSTSSGGTNESSRTSARAG